MLSVSFSRIYMFSAAHRLYSPQLSEMENKTIYDKCNNINGHGHDYTVEVTVQDQPDPKTGMIVSMTKMDNKVQNILDGLDYHHLDKEVPYFKNRISTGEIIIQYLWDKLNKNLPEGLLYHIKLWETNNNYFELGKG